jgi:riboflavin kinase/FMN adenylyltransferase
MLTETYVVRGRVVAGLGQGRLLGYPTANLALAPESSRPPSGVYAGWVGVNNNTRQAGILVSGVYQEADKLPRQEVYLIDFVGDLYEADLTIEVVDKLRDLIFGLEPAAMSQRIKQDIIAAKKILTAAN